MAAQDSQSQFFLCEGLQQPAVQLMAPQALQHWPATGAGSDAAPSVLAPAALAPAQLQQVQHAQHAQPLGHSAMHGGQHAAAYPPPAPGVHLQAPAAAAGSPSRGAAPSQPLQSLQQGSLHVPLMAAMQRQQGGAAGVLYVNQKQLASILRRRAKRQKQEAENKLPRVRQPFVNRAAHQHAKTRPRDTRGKFLSKEEIEAQGRAESELADLADARLGRLPLPELQRERQPSNGGDGGASLPALAAAHADPAA